MNWIPSPQRLRQKVILRATLEAFVSSSRSVEFHCSFTHACLWELELDTGLNGCQENILTDFVHFVQDVQDVTCIVHDILHSQQRVTIEQNFVGPTYSEKNNVQYAI